MKLVHVSALLLACAFLPFGLLHAQDDSPSAFFDLDAILEMLEDGPASGAMVSVRAFTMGPDGEMVEVHADDVSFGDLPEGIPFGGIASFGAAGTIEEMGDLSEMIEDMLENFDFEALGLGDLDLGSLSEGIDLSDFDFGDCAFDCADFDFGDLDLDAMIEDGMTTVRAMVIGPDGQPLPADEIDFEALGLEGLDLGGLTDTIEDMLENLGDLDFEGLQDLGGGAFGRVHTSVSAYAVGPDGQLIELDEVDLDEFLAEIEGIFEGANDDD